jgi:hypothetical protein
LTEFLAYLDPGSGSLVVQAVIATLVAVPFFFRQQIARAVRTFHRDERPRASEADDKGAPARIHDA